jgi:hypothetical protein
MCVGGHSHSISSLDIVMGAHGRIGAPQQDITDLALLDLGKLSKNGDSMRKVLNVLR